MLALETGYSKNNNPYHNCVHAADIAQTSHFMLSQTGLASSLSISPCHCCPYSGLWVLFR